MLTPDTKMQETPFGTPMANAGFRLQNKRIHLTYPIHVDPLKWFEWWENNAGKKHKVAEYSFVNETGKTGHEHAHVLLGFANKLETANCRFFDYLGQHPNIVKVTNKKHWDNTVKYHYKDGMPTTNIVPEGEGKVIEEIWESTTVSDALLKTCKKVGQAGGIIAAFNCKPLQYGPEPSVEWRPWQMELNEELGNKPDDRTILWYFDQKGQSGKTFLAKHYGMYRNAFTSAKANVYHVATAIQKFLKNGKAMLIVIFNFARDTEQRKVYQALESLKDGMITAEKFQGETLYFPSPHVVVFANYLPDMGKISLDRWDIRTIGEDNTVVKRIVGNKEAKIMEKKIDDGGKDTGKKMGDLNDWGKSTVSALTTTGIKLGTGTLVVPIRKTTPIVIRKATPITIGVRPQAGAVKAPIKIVAPKLKTPVLLADSPIRPTVGQRSVILPMRPAVIPARKPIVKPIQF